ncbi:MAG: hypothetical protein WCV86_04850 [Patescibacteria group bacterium]|jgi:thiol-disulfide isomerase/thioredoxin
MKRLSIFFLIISFFLGIIPFAARAQEDVLHPVDVYFFWGDGCPHCAKEESFLEQIQERYPSMRVHALEVWHDAENRALLSAVGNALSLDVSGVPVAIIGGQYIPGYYTDETTGAEIEQRIQECIATPCADPVASIVTIADDPEPQQPEADVPAETADDPSADRVHVPFFGSIDPKAFSLPLLTVGIAALDGFNPCAMWTLVFLIGLLVGMPNARRRWALGGAFIVTSGAVYFLFLAAWLNLLLFIGFVVWVRVAIGFIAIAGGIYYLKEFFQNRDATCKVTGQENRRKIFDRLRRIAQEQRFWLALIGIILLAAAVNLVELICSAGLPAVYTQVLALSHLPAWQYYLYLLLYIFIFMLDDLLVFFIAMKTLQVAGVTGKYARASHIIGGSILLLLGILLLLKPEWLMFG